MTGIRPPPFRTIGKIEIPRAVHSKLENGIDLYAVSAGSQEITRLEFIFRAGMYHQPGTLIASCTNALLESGTKSYTANQISEGVDFFGSYLEFNVDQDYAIVSLYTLNRFLSDNLKYIEEVLKSPVFPPEEFRIHIANKRQKHAINSEKVGVLAKRRFTSMIFGAAHPYGREVSDADFDRIQLQDVKNFFSEFYNSGNCVIIAAGALPVNLGETLNGFFGREKWGKGTVKGPGVEIAPSPGNKTNEIIARGDAVQSAIRTGRLLFNRTHPDYFRFQVLNTALGGYFGSRLMANIREEKGYTYGVGSGVASLRHGGFFFISTEVGCEVTAATIDEVNRELNKLRSEPVSDTELETVRNYMLGNFLRSIDGPFALADKFRVLWDYGLDYSYYDNYFNAVKTVTAAELHELAIKYLDPGQMITCVAGRFNETMISQGDSRSEII